MSIAVATPRHSFGLKGDVSGNVCFADEQTIVYPSGANTLLYNIDQKSQRFIPGSDKSTGTSAMCVSPNRRYVAVAEKGAEKASITIYDLHSLRKKKTLSSVDIQSQEIASLAFSPDSKYLIAQGGRPDWTLVYWTWEKSKVTAVTKTSNPANNDIHQISFNPQDNTQICVVGDGIFKLFRYSEGNLKQFAFQKTEPQNYLSHAWISDERVIVGTDNGKLYIFEAGELKSEMSLSFQPKEGDMNAITEQAVAGEGALITSIISYSKGFACSGGKGIVHLFERTEDKESFKKSREIKTPNNAIGADPTRTEGYDIRNLTVSPSEETLIATTTNNQLYCIALSATDLGKGDQATFESLSQPFHFSIITGLDICIRKPLIATCSMDRSVRVWNYETSSLELYKEFQEEAYSIALHPSGLYILVGFSDKLRLMNLLIDDIRTFKEFTIRGCKECSFSNGGHLFAAVHGNVIQIYSASTFENVNNLKGHNGKVRSVVWSSDDSKIISCGMDGAVYEWNSYSGKREGESVLKSCSYTSVTTTPDGKTTFAVGSDRTVKEISDSQILREVDSNEVTLSQVVMSHSGRMLFAGTGGVL
ncbi:putative cilia- and flagella-associated protein 57 [Apostichopus japonicus]|uniref:Putative cilia-and flagella-associated protein 57 n=1 Tax=Stichopus japonicus TaxID=307972 RepID=A0A2G8JUY1_STIJA|nr:putative cilia- and flagella-associated protein 57 [Apostichopus japonicus]